MVELNYKFPAIYCPWLPEGSTTNLSEDSIGGICRIVSHNISDPWAYGVEEYIAKAMSQPLKMIWTSPSETGNTPLPLDIFHTIKYETEEKTIDKCICDIQQLMIKGCQCGGK